MEVSERVSYRKIGHAFRSNSRRLTAERNAEIAAAEEAARTGKKYEEVLAEASMKKAASNEADEEEEERPKTPPTPKPRTPSPRDLPLSATAKRSMAAVATNTAPAASLPMPSVGAAIPSAAATSMPTADAMLQLEVRRRNLEERENRLLQMRMEMQAELEARNSMGGAGFGAPGSLYNARGMNSMAMGGMGSMASMGGMTGMGTMGGMGGMSGVSAYAGGMNPALLAQRRAAMASKLTPSFALQGAAGMGMGMGAALMSGPSSAAMPGMMTPTEMELAMARAGRMPGGGLPVAPLGGPTHGDGMLVDMLVKRSQMVKPPPSMAGINALQGKSVGEEGRFRYGGVKPSPPEKKSKKKKRKHNRH